MIKPRPPYEKRGAPRPKGFVVSEETKRKMAIAQQKRWGKVVKSDWWQEDKTCVVCGQPFCRRQGEPRDAFVRRKKCVANCVSIVMNKLTPCLSARDSGTHAERKVPRPDPKFTAARNDIVFESRTWHSVNRHWLKFHD